MCSCTGCCRPFRARSSSCRFGNPVMSSNLSQHLQNQDLACNCPGEQHCVPSCLALAASTRLRGAAILLLVYAIPQSMHACWAYCKLGYSLSRGPVSATCLSASVLCGRDHEDVLARIPARGLQAHPSKADPLALANAWQAMVDAGSSGSIPTSETPPRSASLPSSSGTVTSGGPHPARIPAAGFRSMPTAA